MAEADNTRSVAATQIADYIRLKTNRWVSVHRTTFPNVPSPRVERILSEKIKQHHSASAKIPTAT